VLSGLVWASFPLQCFRPCVRRVLDAGNSTPLPENRNACLLQNLRERGRGSSGFGGFMAAFIAEIDQELLIFVLQPLVKLGIVHGQGAVLGDQVGELDLLVGERWPFP